MEVETVGPYLDPGGTAAAAQRQRLYHLIDASSQATAVYSAASEDSSTNDGLLRVFS